MNLDDENENNNRIDNNNNNNNINFNNDLNINDDDENDDNENTLNERTYDFNDNRPKTKSSLSDRLDSRSRAGLRERSKSGSDEFDVDDVNINTNTNNNNTSMYENDSLEYGARDSTATTSSTVSPTSSSTALAEPKPLVPMTTHEVALFGLYFAPLWFIANLTFNWSLALTSVSSSTIIASTSGLFTLIIGVAMRLTKFHWAKLLGVLLTIGGVVVVALSDRGSVRSETLLGDGVSLLSAVAYACYANVLKRRIDDEERISMAMFFGFVGLWNLVLFWPVFILLHYTGLETFVLPEWNVLGFLTLNGLVGTVLSDWIWLQSMLLTSALVSTLGLSMTIPAAILFDWMRAKSFSFVYLIGSALVLIGFVTATIAEHRSESQ